MKVGLCALLALACFAATLPAAGHAQSLRERLVGTWQLESWLQVVGNTEEPGPLGRQVPALLLYTPDGYMCVSGMQKDRENFGTSDFRAASAADKARAFESHFSYCGRFEVDESERSLRHTVDVSSLPNYVGTLQKRFIQLDGDRLTLTSPVRKVEDRESRGVLTWRRAR